MDLAHNEAQIEAQTACPAFLCGTGGKLYKPSLHSLGVSFMWVNCLLATTSTVMWRCGVHFSLNMLDRA